MKFAICKKNTMFLDLINQVQSNALELLSIVVIFLSVLKIIEMYYHKHLVNKGVAHSFNKLPISAKIDKITIAKIIFKVPTLIIILIIIGFFKENNLALYVSITISTFLWILILRMLSDLLMQGTNRYLSSVLAPNLQKSENKNHEIHNRIKDFVYSIILYVILVIVGYASIYYTLNNQFDNAFNGIKGYEIISFIYYSIVTFGTVGYGDIVPNPNSSPACNLLTHLFVASEIFLSFIVVAIFIASFSLKFSTDINDNEIKNK